MVYTSPRAQLLAPRLYYTCMCKQFIPNSGVIRDQEVLFCLRCGLLLNLRQCDAVGSKGAKQYRIDNNLNEYFGGNL